VLDDGVQRAGGSSSGLWGRVVHAGLVVVAWGERPGGGWCGIPEQQSIDEGNGLSSSEAGAEHQ
jgi:hypothetical protein